MEELVTDENGKVTTLSLGDKPPTMMDIHRFTVLIEGRRGPLHVKMAGELTSTGIARPSPTPSTTQPASA